MSAFSNYSILSLPLFGLVAAGVIIASLPRWRPEWTRKASTVVFAFVLPVMLFRMMSHRDAPPDVDARLLLAFFGGCLIVYGIGRIVAARAFHLDGASQSIFAMGGIFSNNVMLGLPIAKLTLGPAAIPAVALVLVFNALILWTLVSVSVEWAQHGQMSLAGIGKTLAAVARNPIVLAIVSGSIVGALELRIPGPIDTVMAAVGALAAPSALVALGMGLTAYRADRALSRRAAMSSAICTIKLFVHPLVVGALGWMLGLPALELKVVVLLASIAVGVNVYLMSIHFERLQQTIATSLLWSTALATLTTPLLLTLLG